MKTHRGDVVLVLFPNSDLRTAKRRPALLQRDDLRAGLPQTIVAMISSNLARRGHPSRVFVSVTSAEGKAAGLRLDSVLMTDNLATVLEKRNRLCPWSHDRNDGGRRCYQAYFKNGLNAGTSFGYNPEPDAHESVAEGSAFSFTSLIPFARCRSCRERMPHQLKSISYQARP